MLLKLLGMIDILAGIILIFTLKVYTFISIIMIILLLIKSSLSFWKDIGSWIDSSVAFAFLISIFYSLPIFLLFILGILILQKGIFSFFGEF